MNKRLKNLLLTFSLLFLHLNVYPQVTFFKSYDGFTGHAFVQASDGGFILTGTDIAMGSTYKVCLLKTDALGTIEWTKCFGGDSLEWPDALIRTHNNNYVIAGRTKSFGAGEYDMYVIRTDSSGDTLWTRTYGETGDDEVECILETADSNLIIAGSSFSFNSAGTVLLIKTDRNGEVLWSKTYGLPGYHFASSYVYATADSGYIIGGRYWGGISDYSYLLKTDSVGNKLWDRTYGPSNLNIGSRNYCVKQTADHGFIAAGIRGMPPGTTGVFMLNLFKTNSNGVMLWDKSYGDTSANPIDYGYSIDLSSDGGFIVGGITSSFGPLQMTLLKTDSLGNLLWSQAYGGANSCGEARSIMLQDSSFALTGSLGIFSGYSYSMIKTDQNGNTGCYDAGSPTQVYPNSITGSNAWGVVTTQNIIAGKPPTRLVNHTAVELTVCLNIGVDEIPESTDEEIFPNPSTGKITFRSAGRLTLFNAQGAKFYATNLSVANQEIIFSDIPAGIYFYMLQEENQELHSGKLIIID